MTDYNIRKLWRLWVDHKWVDLAMSLNELDALFDEGVIDECMGLPGRVIDPVR